MVFDDPNLVSCAGLAPVVALADRAGLAELVADIVTVPSPAGVNAPVKVVALVAGMVASADCIDGMDLLRHDGMRRLFTGIRAPSTLGTFLRAFTFGHVRQLDAVAARVLAGLARTAPLLPGADTVTYVDIDDTVRVTHGYLKQGSGFGYSGVRGLNVLLSTLSTPLAAPVMAATRLRRGPANAVRGAARLVADTLATAKNVGADPRRGALVVLRADSAFFAADIVAAARRARARFSITARMTATVKAAIVEQVIADLKNGPLAHLPSGKFTANAAWRVLAAIAFNLTRAAATLTGSLHARTTTATVRTRLIAVPARLARSARRLTLHLPTDWPWQTGWQQLADATLHAFAITFEGRMTPSSTN